MLLTDQDNWSAPQSAQGYSGTAGPVGGRLHEIAREIEETQRRQGETMQHIVERLRTLDPQRRDTPAAPAIQATLDQAGDEPWDRSSAEALMRSYETGPSETTALPPLSGPQQSEWLSDVTHRIKRTLSDLKRGNTIVLLEERLDQFQRHITSALDDVVRRSDVEGLRLIEAHVNDLGDKLDVLERHVQRLDAVETDVRNIMDQVSDERIGKLLDYDSRFTADLETLAKRVAEEMHARFGRSEERDGEAARRHEELRALIEASIQDRRQAEAEATTLVSGLSGRINAQSDRNDEIKSLLDHAIEEQRQHEKTAVGMLDTLQQALVEVLDRLDALESQQRMMAWPVADAPAGLHHFVPADDDDPPPAGASADAAPRDFADMRFNDAAPARDLELPAPVEIPAAFGEPAPTENGNDSPVERLRRDFVADARRAKMKAAANRAEAVAETSETPKRSGIESARAALTQAARLPLTQGSGRLFGASPKLLAGALVLVVAINGGLLLLNRKNASRAPVPEITIQHEAPGAGAQDPAAEAGNGENPDAPAIAPSNSRSDLNDGGTGLAEFAQPSGDDPLPPYGYTDDVLNPPAVDSIDGAASAPHGMTISKPAGSVPNDVVADVYQQQVLASLSGKLGTIAATHSSDALIPERSGRIDTAYTTSDSEAEAVKGGEAGDSALDLPPATVGPLSLRLAAASGDASAEFEVAARLAEGKGTAQSFAEALRWYQRSAAKGFAQAQYRLGTLYERGLGVSKDVGRARVWYSRAAEQGNIKSMHNLAVLAAGGEADPDYATAIQWFGKAAEHGLADSQYNLGVLLENGLGVKADRVTAYKWYSLAAKTGDADAKVRQDALKTALSAEDLKSAEGLIAAYKPLAAIPLANDARAAGEDWKKRVNNDTSG